MLEKQTPVLKMTSTFPTYWDGFNYVRLDMYFRSCDCGWFFGFGSIEDPWIGIQLDRSFFH